MESFINYLLDDKDDNKDKNKKHHKKHKECKEDYRHDLRQKTIIPIPTRGPTGPDGTTGPMGPIGPTGLEGPTGPIGQSGQEGTNGIDGAISIRYTLQGITGSNPINNFFTTESGQFITQATSFKFSYFPIGTYFAEGFFDLAGEALINSQIPYLQITQVNNPNHTSLYKIINVQYFDIIGIGPEYYITVQQPASVFGSGLWVPGEVYTISINVNGNNGQTGPTGPTNYVVGTCIIESSGGGIEATQTITESFTTPTSKVFLTQTSSKGNFTDYWVSEVRDGSFDIRSFANGSGGSLSFNYLVSNI